ncbi:restriction endonuclease subunit S [uncultured Ferrimonas sp.]|uniref:restriction endonuclease subunit S n=1 Tax=uncultured Ferrimonas sp. TaxID=432640 RepID=UPI002619C417|nr:restriction endonuclease subunit S [uncultured Ferrimonas sp.]
MSEVLPNGWGQCKFGNLFEIAIGGTPSRSEPKYWDSSKTSGNSWVSIKDLKGRYVQDTAEQITDIGVSNSNVKLITQGTVIMSFKLSVGKVAYAGKDLYTNEAIAAFKPTTDQIDVDYFYHGLHFWDLLSDIDQAVKGVTLNKEKLKNIDALLPPLPEQRKIAEILTSVDTVIERTQAQIDKLKAVKTGMMQELLSPTPENYRTGDGSNTAFKDSPLGLIPEGWEIETLETQLASTKYPMRSGPFGSALLKNELVPKGHPYLGIDNVHVEHFESTYRRYVSDEKFAELKRYAVFEGDVMITIMGTVGRSCVVPRGVGKALSSKHVWTMTFDQSKYLSVLACWQLNYATWVQEQFRNESQGGVMESISSKTLKNLLLPIPPIAEQLKIAKAHNTISRTIEFRLAQLEQAQRLKKALMQDLLTGKVRVTVDS